MKFIRNVLPQLQLKAALKYSKDHLRVNKVQINQKISLVPIEYDNSVIYGIKRTLKDVFMKKTPMLKPRKLENEISKIDLKVSYLETSFYFRTKINIVQL